MKKSLMEKKVIGDFISTEKKTFRWRLGKVLASSLSGFLAGIIVGGFIFMTVFYLILRWNKVCF
ncbi:MAG TPA: hypothetical protein PKI61_04295 [bacterium]|nr:hypothetical protein [bacterium]HPT30065.1 hypothetical protein [bacterium]